MCMKDDILVVAAEKQRPLPMNVRFLFAQAELYSQFVESGLIAVVAIVNRDHFEYQSCMITTSRTSLLVLDFCFLDA